MFLSFTRLDLKKKGVEGCGRVWKGVEGCGRMWKGVEGCGRVWKGVEGFLLNIT